uniref:NADH dehydrogenase subunit 6 n=1 Tax=Leptotrombidium pallidum TaxID=279272 RepID=Q4W8D9_9ACAR|nr:NADH dehydrogenase subunit 6 [Leptotrombidium pallidum]BAD99500.1 NADH dehydrogenase subunit 6 [Leptotrombidium pallidum]
MIYFIFFPIISLKFLSSSSPMKVLLTILFIAWNICLVMLDKGQNFWVPIFIIMLFNGGLMVLFIFSVSMIPKEKSENFSNIPLFLSMLTLLVFMNFQMEIKVIGEFFFQNWWMMVFGTIMMLIFFMSISMMMIDFFKTMKSI